MERPFKRCNHCGQIKPAEQFSWQYKAFGQRHPWCKACMREARTAARNKRLEHYRAVNRAWNDRHRAEVAEYNRKYRGRGIVPLAVAVRERAA